MRQRISVYCNDAKINMHVEDNRITKCVLFESKEGAGILTYKVKDEIFMLECDDSYIYLEAKISDHNFKKSQSKSSEGEYSQLFAFDLKCRQNLM